MVTSISAKPTRRADAAQDRYRFISQLHDIVGAERMRLLWLPKGTDTTTTTSADRYARTFTYDATIAARLSALGMGYAVSFAGTPQYAETPDVDALSFGDGLNDSPFSVVALVNITDTATVRSILAKYDLTTGSTKREWSFFIESGDTYQLACYDESAATRVGAYKNSAPTQGSWTLLCGTYDGTRNRAGFALYDKTTRVDDTNYDSGTYTAMENTASKVYLGAWQGASAQASFFRGSMAMVALVSRQLQPDDLWAITNLCNGFFNLSLGV